MNAPYEKWIGRWVAAGVLDGEAAERIREYESKQGSSERLRWPVLLALAFGGLLLCAGVLLFVSAHWDELSPASRFSLVLLMVTLFPLGGAFAAERFPALSMTLFAIGTVCTGAGIFLAAQIFNLEEHWPNGILLWAVGALAGWLLLKNWAQAMLLALLAPAWLAGEWEVRVAGNGFESRLVSLGLLLLALTYFTARVGAEDSAARKALVWVGGILALPLAVWAFTVREEYWWSGQHRPAVSMLARVLAWTIAILGPLALSYALRRRKFTLNIAAAVWVLVIASFHSANRTGALLNYTWNSLGPYLWAGIGAAGVVGWGLLEGRKERINLGVAGFALTVAIFYFSSVMDKLGRATSLIGMGLLLLLGGWALERTRRKLLGHMERSAP